MEISNEVITEAFVSIENSAKHDELDALLDKLNTFDSNSILLKGESADLRKIDQKIYRITANVINPQSQDSKEILTSILLTIKKYFDVAVTKADIKSLLIFLSVNCYLKVDIKQFKSGETETAKLSESIARALKNVNLETQLKAGAPYHERELKTNSVEGIKEGNINKIYEVILAMERGGRGFHFNYLLENLISFLFRFDVECFVKYVNTLDHPETVVFYLQSFDENDLQAISTAYNQDNRWVHFELIRQIVENEAAEYDSSSKSIEAIVKSLTSLYQNNNSIFEQAIVFFHRSKFFNSALGYLMKDLTEEEIFKILADTIPLDIYNNNLDQRTILLDEFSKVVSDDLFHKSLTIAFNRWTDFWTSIANNEESYQSHILLTDYANFVVQYYSQLLDDNEIVTLINAKCKQLIWINSEWFKSQSQQITKYHLYLTEVFLLSYAYKTNKLSNTETITLIAELLKNHIYETKGLTNNIDPLPTIENNINWTTSSP